MILALIIGAGAGLGAIVFRYLILCITRFFSGHDDYSATAGITHRFFSSALNPHAHWLGIAFVVAAPIIGALSMGRLSYAMPVKRAVMAFLK